MLSESLITVKGQVDIVLVRMRVREAARKNGLSLTDQACISMAASSVVTSLIENDGSHEGQIAIERLTKGNRTGLKVICRWEGLSRLNLSTNQEHWMVDEIDLSEESGGVLKVSLTKWTKK